MSFIATAAKNGLDAEKGKEKKESKTVPMSNRRFRRSLKEGRGWNYDMPQELCGILREAIREEDYITVLETLKNCYDWILENVEYYTEYEYEDDISDIDIQIENINDGYSFDEDEPYDAGSEVDYLLQNFYDVCDGYRIWVTP